MFYLFQVTPEYLSVFFFGGGGLAPLKNPAIIPEGIFYVLQTKHGLAHLWGQHAVRRAEWSAARAHTARSPAWFGTAAAQSESRGSPRLTAQWWSVIRTQPASDNLPQHAQHRRH